MTTTRQEHRHSNSFTADAVAAFQALYKQALLDRKFLPIVRSKGMQELAKKFCAMHKKDAEREGQAA